MSQSAIQGFPAQGPPRVRGEAILQRLFDVGYEIHLDRAFSLLASIAPERPRPVRGQAQAIQIPNPPITVQLGTERALVGGRSQEVELSARLFDFGVIRASTWRRGIDRKVDIIRNSYNMLNAESQARRSEVLELVVVALILAEIVLAFVRH